MARTIVVTGSASGIGQATARTAAEQGLRVDVVASEARLDTLVSELADHARILRDEQIAAGTEPLRPSQTRARSRRKK